MAIIVASLFLPYQPEFKLVDNDDLKKTNDLIDSNLVKVNNPNQINNPTTMGGTDMGKRSKRSSSVHSQKPFNLRRQSTPSNVLDTSMTITGEFDDELEITSEQFLENLRTNIDATTTNPTANATNNGTTITNTSGAVGTSSAIYGTDKNIISSRASVEDFFNANDILDNSDLELNNDFLNNNENLTTNNIDSNPNKDLSSDNSTTLHSVFDTVTQQVSDSLSSRDKKNSTIIRPKSRMVPDFKTTAVVDMDKLKLKHQELHSAPSMKRTTLTGNPSTIKEEMENEIDSVNIDNEKKISNTENEEVNLDFENDSNEKFFVPKFGGFSKKITNQNSRLINSHELFSQLPWSIVPCEKGNGSLKNAINIATKEKTITNEIRWVGSIGIPTDEIPTKTTDKISKTLSEKFNSHAVITDDITFKGAYKNYCKKILWPTLHYQIPDNPNSKAFEDHSWNYYKTLNQLFANKIVETYKDGDTIWIHDYHLMLVPNMVRKLLPNAKIGFFLHVSFPSSEVFRCFAQREKILIGMLGANSIGFQTTEYARHFIQTSNRLLMLDVSNDELKFNGKIISINSIPVGVDCFALKDHLQRDKVTKWRKLIKQRWNGKKLIICRDSFDKIRGINKKMLAFERFLRENPNYIDKVVLIQICLGKTEDSELERQVMLIVDRINSLSSNIGMSPPVVFLHQELDFPQYLALNSEADLFLVSSFREGMNLTCHEFIVSSSEKNAPLLLSEFTGSASVLSKGSILINPWDIKHLAESIKRGLEMPYAERRRHWKSLMKSVITNDSDRWIKNSIQDINMAWENNQERLTILNLSYDTIYEEIKQSDKRLFIFKISEPPTARTLSILNELTNDNIVYVMNSHSKSTLERLYARVSNIGLIAENGAYVRIDSKWYNIVEEVNWKSEVIKILDAKIERLPGSYYKMAESMIRFHTENAEDKDRVSSVIGEAITHINTLFDEKNVHAYLHKNILFVQQNGLSLSALRFLLNYYNKSITEDDSQSHIEFICATGSTSPVIEPIFNFIKEKTTEDLIRFGHGVVYGDTTSTNAKEHVSGLNELLTILQNIPK